MVSGEGVVYESGKQVLDGITPVGGADDVSLTAEFRSGDWISGNYTVAGEMHPCLSRVGVHRLRAGRLGCADHGYVEPDGRKSGSSCGACRG